MKNIKLSLLVLISMGALSYAGGDISPVTEYETEDVQLAEEAYVEPEIVEEYVPAPKPVELIPPIMVKPKSLPTPEPEPLRDIHPSGFYAGLGITAAQYQTNCKCTTGSKSGEDKTGGLMVRAGYDFNQYIGVEARGMKTNWKSSGGKVKHIGVFAKPMLPIGEATNVYGLAGLAKTTTEGSLRKTDSTNFALGAGIEVDLSKDIPKDGRYGRKFDGKGDQEQGLGLFLDYERLIVKSGSPDIDAVSAGVTYDF